MLMTSQPLSWNQRLSARVEKRGPWMTTMVPPSWAVMPRASASLRARARRSGQEGAARGRGVAEGVGGGLGAVGEGVAGAPGPVDQLVADDEGAGGGLGLDGAGGAGADD